jgi:hypothetical protein
MWDTLDSLRAVLSMYAFISTTQEQIWALKSHLILIDLNWF